MVELRPKHRLVWWWKEGPFCKEVGGGAQTREMLIWHNTNPIQHHLESMQWLEYGGNCWHYIHMLYILYNMIFKDKCDFDGLEDILANLQKDAILVERGLKFDNLLENTIIIKKYSLALWIENWRHSTLMGIERSQCSMMTMYTLVLVILAI